MLILLKNEANNVECILDIKTDTDFISMGDYAYSGFHIQTDNVEFLLLERLQCYGSMYSNIMLIITWKYVVTFRTRPSKFTCTFGQKNKIVGLLEIQVSHSTA